MFNNDFYYDEAITLTDYVYKSLHHIIFHYVNLNNHFLFSVITNIYVHVFRIDFNYLLDHPYLIRLPIGIFALITIYYLYKLGGWMSVLILCTTIPYLYYIFAVRGYSLSIMLITALFYYLHSKYYYIVAILTALFCYVMPSNYAFIIILLLFYIGQLQRKAIVIGIMLSFIMYSPVCYGIVHDPIANQHLFNWSVLTDALPQTINAFISYRYLLIIPFIIGWLHYDLKELTVCSSMCLLPFVLFFIQGGHVYERIMFPALPFFCLFIGRGLNNCLRLLKN